LTRDEILALQACVREERAPADVMRYATTLARATRPGPDAPDNLGELISWGAGPRAAQALVMASKARALMDRRTHVTIEDIQALAKPVLRHRIVVNFAAESDGIAPDDIIDSLLQTTPTLEDELANDARFQAIFAS
jgi:MoxR-like ATPase